MNNNSPRRPRALITGASSGIGREMAHVLAAAGHPVVLVARRERELHRLATELIGRYGVGVDVLAMDLSVARAAEELASHVEGLEGGVGILVNCAGFAISGSVAECDVELQLRLLQLNIVTLTHLTRLLLPGMLQRGWGRILNIASIASYMPGPTIATYFASKAYVLSFTEGLSHELGGTGVTATALVVGPTRTGFAMRAGLAGTPAFRRHLMEAHDVAECGYRALMSGRAVVVAGWWTRLRMLPVRILPRRLLAHFARRYHEHPEGPDCEPNLRRLDVNRLVAIKSAGRINSASPHPVEALNGDSNGYGNGNVHQ